MKQYELINHTADMGIRVFGEDPKKLFRNAGFALFDIICDLSRVSGRQKRVLNLKRENMAELLVEWLAKLLYIYETELFLFCEFTIDRISNQTLKAEAWGDIYNEKFHKINTQVKAVTYHQLDIHLNKDGIWVATVILDV